MPTPTPLDRLTAEARAVLGWLSHHAQIIHRRNQARLRWLMSPAGLAWLDACHLSRRGDRYLMCLIAIALSSRGEGPQSVTFRGVMWCLVLSWAALDLLTYGLPDWMLGRRPRKRRPPTKRQQ